jgi:aminomethyltransferase
MRKIRVSGLDASRFFDHLLTRPVRDLPVMRGTYIIFCNDDGSLKDDAILYKYADNDYLLMPSDVDHSHYFESVRKRFDLGNVSFTECTNDWVGLAIQGPRSAGALHAMGFVGIEQLAPFFIRDFKLDTGKVKISRMGFTADLGYEMWFAPGLAESVMNKVRAARAEMGIELPGYGLDALQVC